MFLSVLSFKTAEKCFIDVQLWLAASVVVVFDQLRNWGRKKNWYWYKNKQELTIKKSGVS